MAQIIQIGKPAPVPGVPGEPRFWLAGVEVPSVRDLFQQLAQREADEIKRLKQAISARLQH